MTKFGFLIALLATVACGSNPKTDTTTTGTGDGEATCAAVAEHLRTAMAADDGEMAEMSERAAPVIRQHCESEGWTAEARTCSLAVTHPEAIRECITADQGKSLDDAMEGLDGEGAESGKPAETAPSGSGLDPYDDSEDP